MSILETMDVKEDKIKIAYTVGRFQPPTIGHRMLIRKTIEAANGGKAYVFVSSTQGKGKEALRNPLTSAQKIPLLKKMFPMPEKELEFVDTANCKPKCGGPGAALGYLLTEKKHDPREIAFVVGKERMDRKKNPEAYFGPGASVWGAKPEPTKFVEVGHSVERKMETPANDENNMSGTKARGYVHRGEKANFYIAVGYDPAIRDEDVEAVYEAIKSKPQAGGDEEEEKEELPPTVGGPDGEPLLIAGRRKTRRIKKSKASGKALYRRGLRSRTGSLRTSRS